MVQLLKFSGILWDMDGVLVDSGDLHFDCWTRTLQDYGLTYTRENFDQTFGMNNEGILKLLLGENSDITIRNEISRRKEILFRQAVPGHVQPLPGAREWLERFQHEGLRQAVASSAPQENIDVLVDALGLRDYFVALVSAYTMPGKPDPAVFLEAARQIGAEPQRALVIEDGLPGVEAAHRAGMKCLAVTTTNPANLLSKADQIVDGLDQLTWDDLLRL
jgi:beta-phosphoglucomutase